MSSSSHFTYQRSPEMRQTHKIAERRRRRDMSALYDDLKEIFPDEKGTKSSKQDILTRTVNVVRYVNEYASELHREINEYRARLNLPPKRFPPLQVAIDKVCQRPESNRNSMGSEDRSDSEQMDTSK
ncbi:uncharacterized protein V1516DRAFT_676097 [Lipomyces oligophaga]|uniref:uncharacterized protein n=1 Tax=Lipomyces oligophaga TaxID=45792 RepID=UPI0034CF1204